PSNAPFEAVPELQRVLGMTPALYAKLADSLTVHSRMAGVNPVYASRTVLMSLPGATAEMVDTYIAQRRDALAAKLPPRPFPLTGGIANVVNVWRIHVEATMSDGVTFVREAVVRAGTDRRRLLVILEWQEGARILTAAAAQQGTADDGTRAR